MFKLCMAGDRQRAQNGLNFGQATLNYTLKVVLEFCPCTQRNSKSKLAARSQKVTRIFKSQIGHATHVSWSTLVKEFDYCVHCVV